MLDLNDKFDYFICMMLKSKEMTLDDMTVDDGDVRASHIHLNEQGREQRDVLEKFKKFQENAISADLGSRQAMR